jgi:hypothetical protein
MMHSQIISRLYTTLINFTPTAYRERTKKREEKKQKKEALKLSLILHSVTVRRVTSS